MTETPNKSNEQVIKKPLFSYERIRCLKPKNRPVNAGKEPPKKKPSKSRLAECEEILGTRCRKREPSGWDIRTIGKKGTPAEILRSRAYYDQEFRGFKNPGVTAELLGVSLSFVKKWTQIGKAAKDSGQSIRNAFRSLPTKRVNAPREPSAEQIRTVIEIRKNNPLLGSKKIAVLAAAVGDNDSVRYHSPHPSLLPSFRLFSDIFKATIMSVKCICGSVVTNLN